MSSEEKGKKKNIFKRFIGFFYEKEQRPRYTFQKIGKMRVHNITEPQVAGAIMRDAKGMHGVVSVQETLKQLIGSAMILEWGDYWQVLHDIMAPKFGRPSVDQYIAPIAIEECDKMLDRWVAQGSVDDVEHEMRNVTGAIISRALFGDTLDEKRSAEMIEEISQAVGGTRQPKGLGGRIMRFFNVPHDHAGFIPPFVLRVLGISYDAKASVPKSFKKAKKTVDSILYPLIEKRRKLETQPEDILGSLITARKPDGTGLTDEEIRDQVLMLVVAGHETTAMALTFSVMELLKNPSWQQGIRDDFKAVAGRPLTGKDLPALSHATNAFKEALRLHPTVYMSNREAFEDRDFGDIHIKSRDIVRIDLRAMQRDPVLWPSPDTFDPERFAKVKFPPGFLPFGMGPHVCLGMNMSLSEGGLMLAQIFNRVSLEATGPMPEKEVYVITTRPDGKISVKVTPYQPPQ